MEILRFVTVDALFSSDFLLFCHFECKPNIINILSLFNTLLNGVRVYADDIATLTNSRNDELGECLFRPVIVGALRWTQKVAHRIEKSVLVPLCDGSAPRADYRYLFRYLDKANRDFFAAFMNNFIVDFAVKLPFVVDGNVYNVMDKFLSDLLPPHVYTELKAKRGDNIRRVADAAVPAHDAHATAIADSTKPAVSDSTSETPYVSARSTFLSPSIFSLPTAPITSPPVLPTNKHSPSLIPQATSQTPSPAIHQPCVYRFLLDTVISLMEQECEDLFTRHACTSAAKRRHQIRAEKFAALLSVLTAAFAFRILPDHPRKRLRLASVGPPENFLPTASISSLWISHARRETLSSASSKMASWTRPLTKSWAM